MSTGLSRNRRLVACALIFAVSTGSLVPPATAGDWLNKVKGKWHGHKGIASAEALAAEIECLEKHVDWYGSIVAKQPDVWGQARLMKYRQEFEQTLFKQLNTFEPTLQASISRTDQAFLAQAFSLSAAVTGAPATLLPPSQSTSQAFFARRRAALQAGGIDEPTQEQLGATEPLPTIEPPTSNPAADLVSGFDEVVQRNDIALDTGVGFASDASISLEPTVFLDQLARYVNHLHEIRRVNEGDDTADAPGYALHLVRIPVSILPGTHTRKGYGAEITITATPYLGRDLLPTTFRNLVINDLVEQISTPLTAFFNSPTSREGFENLRALQMKAIASITDPTELVRAPILGIPPDPAANAAPVVAPPAPVVPVPAPTSRRMAPPASSPVATPTMTRITAGQRPVVPRLAGSGSGAPPIGSGLGAAVSAPARPVRTPAVPRLDPTLRRTSYLPIDQRTVRDKYYQAFSRGEEPQAAAPNVALTPTDENRRRTNEGIANATNTIDVASQGIQAASSRTVPASRARNSRFAFPGTQVPEVYGMELILPVAFECFDVMLRKPLENKDAPTVLPAHRVMSYIQDQVSAAHDLLSRPEMAHLWAQFATPDLARAVQARDESAIRAIRSAFLASLPNAGLQIDRPYGPRYTTTAAFAWAILVESVLLNERLIQDIHESASAKGGAPIVADGMPFYLPCPPEEVREAFNQYVRTRFPIHVFALDPVNQEQNLADQLSRTREMQLALSLAFVTGNISAGSMTRFARRLELEAQTIALNRTQVAFSHGDDTFGWRFQPRYQTPPTQGNLAAFRDTLIGGPTREQDRRQLEIEPGSRECVALVIMPSFVPYATFETRANWFKLNSPKHSEIDPTKFLALSGSIRRAYLLAEHICDTGLYRDGDVALLVNRVKQLAAELPMQRMIAQVPHDNTHGGFELFNVGVTELGPELLSWYGAPGVSPDNGTSLFLVGDNFSVNQTSVVVGNKLLTGDDVSLLSRQVMRINVPPGTQQVIHSGRPSVEASIATPYGVSQSLYIPVFGGVPTPPAPTPPTPPPAPTFLWSTPTLGLAYELGNLGIVQPDDAKGPTRRPARGLLIGLDSRVDLGNTRADLTLRFGKPDEGVPPVTLTDIPYNSTLGAFEIAGADFDSLVDQLFDDQRFGLLFGKDARPRDVAVGRTIIRLKGMPQAGAGEPTTPGPVIPEDVSNTLTIKWFEAP